MKLFFWAAALLFSCAACAATVDTVTIYSNAMHAYRKCVVVQPDHKGQQVFPTLYLLHGYSGSYSDWIKKMPAIRERADTYQILIVCPDGGYSSWYLDSPVDSSMRFETYIGSEVPAYIEAHYPVIRDRKARAITGLSMGGHGGLFLGFRHADFFGACGSMSGGVDLRSNTRRFDVIKRLGDTIAHAENWWKYSVLGVVEQPLKDTPMVIFDCGVDDFFYADNRRLHERMLQLKIPHDYIERPGGHSWDYWANSLEYQLLFFRNYFYKGKS